MLFIYLAMIDDDTQRSKFEYIYHTYYGMMYKVAYELTKDQRLAEDAVHETMVNIIEDIDTIRMDNPKELKSYLYLVTKSKTMTLAFHIDDFVLVHAILSFNEFHFKHISVLEISCKHCIHAVGKFMFQLLLHYVAEYS